MTGSGALHRAGVPGVHDFLFRVPWPWTDATYEAVTLTEWRGGARLESLQTFALSLKIPSSAAQNPHHISVTRILGCQSLLF